MKGGFGSHKSMGKGELYGIQALRGIAAMMVVIHHAMEESRAVSTVFPEWLTLLGAAGVDIFFVISGFIMVYSSFREGERRLSPLTFLVRRATRILPLYWLACGVFLLLIATGHLQHHRPTTAALIRSILLVPTDSPIIGVSWTLVYEAFFYLLFAVSLTLHRRWMALAAQFVLLLASMLLGPHVADRTLAAFLSSGLFLEFALGMALALAVDRLERCGAVARSILVLAGIFLLLGGTISASHTNTNGLSGWVRLVCWGLPALMIVAGATKLGKLRGRLTRIVVGAGDASYSIYLSHVFVMLAYAVALKSPFVSSRDQAGIVPIVTLIALTVGLLVHRVVEMPIERWIKAKSHRPASVANQLDLTT